MTSPPFDPSRGQNDLQTITSSIFCRELAEQKIDLPGDRRFDTVESFVAWDEERRQRSSGILRRGDFCLIPAIGIT
jgi:hypothetical protein